MFSINKNLLPIKCHFFLYSGLETLKKMLPLIYRERGVPNEVVGMVYSTMTILGLLFTAVGGGVADYFKVHRTMLIMLLLVATIGTSSIYFLPDLPQSAPVLAEESGRVERSMQKVFEVEGKGILESSEMKPNSEIIETSNFGLAKLLMTPEFLFLVICHATEQVTTGLVFSIADTLAFKALDGDNTRYGQQKMFSPLGLMINAAVCGYLVDWYSQGLPQKDLLPAFAICLALSVLDISVLAKLKLPETKKIEKGKNILKFLNFKIVLFLVSVFVVGFAMNLMWVFKPLVAEDITNAYDPDFGYHKLLQGLMISMQNLGGTVFYYISGFLIKKLGHTKVFLFGHVCLGLHFVLYYFISNPWFILPLELLQGPSYAILSATAASYAAKIAPTDALGSLQAIQQFVFFSGYVVAGFAGGYVYNSIGGYLTFLLTGCLVFSFAIFYAFSKTIVKLQEKLAMKDAEISEQDVDQAYNLYPTPPPSPLNKSIQLASLDASFMEDFKEISYTPGDNLGGKSSLKRKDSVTSFDSGYSYDSECYDEVIDSVVDEVGFRTSATPRNSVATPKCSIVVDMGSESPRQNSLHKNINISLLESVKNAVTLSPSFRAKGSRSSTRGSKRELSFWASPRIPCEKLD